MVERVQRAVLESMRRRRAYLDEAGDEIRRSNLDMTCTASVIALCLLVLFLAITPCIVRGWTPSVFHLALLPALAAFAFGALLYRRFTATCRLGTVLGTAFACVLCAFIVLIDALSDPDAPSSFAPVLFVTLPSLFVMRTAVMYSIMLAFAAGYCALVAVAKNPAIAQYDVFQMVVAFAFSVCVAHLVMNHRVRAHEVSMRFRELSMRDALSGIYNKQALLAAGQRLLSDAGADATCAVLIIDVDDFKAVNDEHGHLAGDIVLSRMGSLLKELFNDADVIGRFGGDEFVVLTARKSAPCSLHETLALLQRRFKDVCASEIGARTTCSVGAVIAAGAPAATSFPALLERADEALYQAKSDGKDRCRVLDLRPKGGPDRPETASNQPLRPACRQKTH